MELSQAQTAHILKRLPEFELSYETISHKKASAFYNICIAIPTGKKVFIWFTFHQDADVCYLFDLNKDKQINNATQIPATFDKKLALGTLLYGTILLNETTGNQSFLIEDIFYYKGIPLKKSNMLEKLGFLEQFMQSVTKSPKDVLFYLPVMWKVEVDPEQEYPITIPNKLSSAMPYPIHHIQYRAANNIMPYLNVFLNRKTIAAPSQSPAIPQFVTIPARMDLSKPQYKYPTVFQVTADIQFDIYHLAAYGRLNQPAYYNVAYVPNYKSSVFMNGLFRKIRENINLDYIEESDDEDDFQNTDEYKYVDVKKVLLMECIFNNKFKKWVPIKVVNRGSKVVHISKL